MNPGLFGDGSMALYWSEVQGRQGLQPRLTLRGKLTAKDYGIGAVVQIIVEVTAWDLAVGTYAFLGTTTPRPYVLNWVKQQYVLQNPPPPTETNWDCCQQPIFDPGSTRWILGWILVVVTTVVT